MIAVRKWYGGMNSDIVSSYLLIGLEYYKKSIYLIGAKLTVNYYLVLNWF